jgi:hypothetical protein
MNHHERSAEAWHHHVKTAQSGGSADTPGVVQDSPAQLPPAQLPPATGQGRSQSAAGQSSPLVVPAAAPASPSPSAAVLGKATAREKPAAQGDAAVQPRLVTRAVDSPAAKLRSERSGGAVAQQRAQQPSYAELTDHGQMNRHFGADITCLKVFGAGDPLANGLYMRTNQDRRGAPVYRCGCESLGYVLTRETVGGVHGWMIKKVVPELLDREYNGHIDLGEHVCYINTDCNDSEMTPPCSSWVVYGGSAPAPSIQKIQEWNRPEEFNGAFRFRTEGFVKHGESVQQDHGSTKFQRRYCQVIGGSLFSYPEHLHQSLVQDNDPVIFGFATEIELPGYKIQIGMNLKEERWQPTSHEHQCERDKGLVFVVAELTNTQFRLVPATDAPLATLEFEAATEEQAAGWIRSFVAAIGCFDQETVMKMQGDSHSVLGRPKLGMISSPGHRPKKLNAFDPENGMFAVSGNSAHQHYHVAVEKRTARLAQASEFALKAKQKEFGKAWRPVTFNGNGDGTKNEGSPVKPAVIDVKKQGPEEVLVAGKVKVGLEGWLKKKGGGKTMGGRRNWKLRYFVLDTSAPSSPVLHYYARKPGTATGDEAKAKGSVLLCGARVQYLEGSKKTNHFLIFEEYANATNADGTDNGKSSRRNSKDDERTQRSLELQAENDQDAGNWIAALNKSIATASGQPEMQPETSLAPVNVHSSAADAPLCAADVPLLVKPNETDATCSSLGISIKPSTDGGGESTVETNPEEPVVDVKMVRIATDESEKKPASARESISPSQNPPGTNSAPLSATKPRRAWVQKEGMLFKRNRDSK